MSMIEELERAIDELGALHSRLILLVGPPQSGKTSILRCLSERRTATPLNVGADLGRCLAGLSHSQRALSASGLLRELADRHTSDELLLVDNIELLFDRTLKLDERQKAVDPDDRADRDESGTETAEGQCRYGLLQRGKCDR
jgi:chloramphenicol 3-O-phosphotransferase